MPPTIHARPRRLRRAGAVAALAVAPLAAGGLLAGCGGSGPDGASTAPGGLTVVSATSDTGSATDPADAAAAVSAAYAALRSTGYEATTTLTQEADASGLDEALRGSIEEQFDDQASSTTLTRSESPERVSVVQDQGGRTQHLVSYDGTLYVSADGTTWAQATGDAATAFEGITSLGQVDPATHFTGLREDGAGEVAGRPATRYTGALDRARMDDLIAGLTGTLGTVGTTLEKAIAMGDSSATILVDEATGAVAEEQYTIAYTIDVGAIAEAAGKADQADAGVVRVAGTSTQTVTRTGDVTVKEPTATRTVSTLEELGAFVTG